MLFTLRFALHCNTIDIVFLSALLIERKISFELIFQSVQDLDLTAYHVTIPYMLLLTQFILN